MERHCVAVVIPILAGQVMVSQAGESTQVADVGLSEKPAGILAGRLYANLPEGARSQARPHDIMGAPHPIQQEDRVVFDLGKQRFVVMVYELFARPGDDFLGVVTRIAERSGKAAGVQVAVQPLNMGRGDLRVAVTTPSQLQSDREAIHIMTAYVASPDETVQKLSFYINPPALAGSEAWTALSRRIAGSISTGNRQLDTSAGERQLSRNSFLTVPAGYVAYRQEGPDFGVHRIRKLTPLGRPPCEIGIYSGMHPSYLYRQARFSPANIDRVNGMILGKEVEWLLWDKGPEGAADARLCMETIVGKVGEEWVSHYFLSAGDETALDELRGIVESARVAAPVRTRTDVPVGRSGRAWPWVWSAIKWLLGLCVVAGLIFWLAWNRARRSRSGT